MRSMTSFEFSEVAFEKTAVRSWGKQDQRFRNWPIVYIINAAVKGPKPALSDVYVGETFNAESRLLQHLDSPTKQHLSSVRIVLDDTYNKSACLDLETHLIRLLSGDGTYRVLNVVSGSTDANYYDREIYRESFREVFEELLAEGLFTRSISEIENSDLFKLSPFKALSPDQAVAVESILDGLFADIETLVGSTIVIQGEPGTGKTVVATYLLKLLADIAQSNPADLMDADSRFSDFFTDGYRELLKDFKVALVVPQQSLRASIQRVFKRTPGLNKSQVMTPFEVGKSDETWDLLIVDEAHRLNQRANQSSGVLNRDFIDINVKLFGFDDLSKTQLDWIRARSRNQVLLVDPLQSVRPADLPGELVSSLVEDAKSDHRYYTLESQMRVKAGEDYVGYVRSILRPGAAEADLADVAPRKFADYDLRFFEDLGEMHDAIRERDTQYGLARLAAGFAWPWASKTNKDAYDIELDGRSLQWNRTDKDWINSPGSLDEVGSIHTVQGYDLNYTGVVIGNDLKFDINENRLRFDRDQYFDVKGKENNKKLGKSYDDEALLRYVTNVYTVLLTRGIRGTYVYVCEPALRERLRPFFASPLQSAPSAT